MGLLGSNIYIMSIISHRQYNFESLKQYYFEKLYICWCVQSHPGLRGDFGQGSKENISECNNQLELSVYNMWCSYMVLTNPHMKPRIKFIIMKILMKIVKICPKSPRFTVLKILNITRLPNLNHPSILWGSVLGRIFLRASEIRKFGITKFTSVVSEFGYGVSKFR